MITTNPSYLILCVFLTYCVFFYHVRSVLCKLVGAEWRAGHVLHNCQGGHRDRDHLQGQLPQDPGHSANGDVGCGVADCAADVALCAPDRFRAGVELGGGGQCPVPPGQQGREYFHSVEWAFALHS